MGNTDSAVVSQTKSSGQLLGGDGDGAIAPHGAGPTERKWRCGPPRFRWHASITSPTTTTTTTTTATATAATATTATTTTTT